MSPLLWGLSPATCDKARVLFGEERGQPVYCWVCGIDLCTNPDITPIYSFGGDKVSFPCNCGAPSRTEIVLPREWLEEKGLLPR